MIRSFRDKETAKVWNREYSKRLPRDLSNPASNQLEPLKGDRKGEYSIRINKQWRICFKWKDGHAFEVEIADYH